MGQPEPVYVQDLTSLAGDMVPGKGFVPWDRGSGVHRLHLSRDGDDHPPAHASEPSAFILPCQDPVTTIVLSGSAHLDLSSAAATHLRMIAGRPALLGTREPGPAQNPQDGHLADRHPDCHPQADAAASYLLSERCGNESRSAVAGGCALECAGCQADAPRERDPIRTSYLLVPSTKPSADIAQR